MSKTPHWMTDMYQRAILKTIVKRLHEPRRFIQVIAGPRQVGKTTLIRQALPLFPGKSIYATADEPGLNTSVWLEQQFNSARAALRSRESDAGVLLVLDEIQKIPGWSETVKFQWDQDTANGLPIHVVILGSSPLLVQKGLSESLAGRFEIIHVSHWAFGEMRDAFGWDVDTYLQFGGYPGAAPLISDPQRWAAYILDSLVETTISRDILLMTRIDKPALLRGLFELGCSYSGQPLSFNKMLGQLQDAGNTTTLSHYLELLGHAGLLTGVRKYAGERVRQRAGSPKLLVLNTALMTAGTHRWYRANQMGMNPEFHGRLVESAVGAHLANAMGMTPSGGSACGELYYWASGNREVDYLIKATDRMVAIEVKSTARRTSIPGIDAFEREFGSVTRLLVGGQGIPLAEFLQIPIQDLIQY